MEFSSQGVSGPLIGDSYLHPAQWPTVGAHPYPIGFVFNHAVLSTELASFRKTPTSPSSAT